MTNTKAQTADMSWPRWHGLIEKMVRGTATGTERAEVAFHRAAMIRRIIVAQPAHLTAAITRAATEARHG